jgi:hypothetical protein
MSALQGETSVTESWLMVCWLLMLRRRIAVYSEKELKAINALFMQKFNE